MSGEYLHAAISVTGILFSFFLAIYLLKRILKKKLQGSKHIKILNSTIIGSKEKLILIEVNQSFILLGATSNHIETLYVFNEWSEAKEIAKKVPFLNNFKVNMTRLQQAKSEVGI